jgi:hypothetical protein
MIHSDDLAARRRRAATWTLLALALCGCSATIGDNRSSGGPHGMGGPGGPGGPDGPSVLPPGCDGTEVVTTQRLVRLTWNQIGNSLRGLLDPTAVQPIVDKWELDDGGQRSFPPLLSPREGTNIGDAPWQKGDNVGNDVGKYVFDNFAAVTKCGAMPTDACAQQYVTDFAVKAFRRPLTADEKTSILQVYTDSKAAGASVQEATQYGVYAAIDAPQFLYRTELGDTSTVSGSEIVLTPYEIASQLSYFLTDGPPDQAMAQAAQAGMLTSTADITAQVKRLLASQPVKTNLQTAMFAYFSLSNLDNVQIDPSKFPQWTPGLKNAMYHESEVFLDRVLWGGAVSELLTSRKTLVNADLAKIYGITSFPPAGATLDKDMFAEVELSADRAGLLTQAGFLTSKARPDKDSVVARGLLINGTLLCAQNPPFPENLTAQISAANAMLSEASEREKADYRRTHSPCSSCHPNFDPYGLTLEPYDALGNFRAADDKMRPIDPSVTLPAAAGGGVSKNAADMAQQLVSSGAFVTCMTRNIMQYAIASGPVETDGCAVAVVAKRFNDDKEQTFTDLVREIAVSRSLAVRSTGGAQ